MHTAQAPERLDLGRGIRSVEVHVLAASQLSLQFAGADAKRTRGHVHQLAAIRHLVGRDAHMVELLRHRELDAPTIIDRSPPGLERVTGRAARLGLLRPVAPLDQLQLTGAQHHQREGEREAALQEGDALGGAVHGRRESGDILR